MKIRGTLDNGVHPVIIEKIIEGLSEHKQTRYFACVFTNDFGFHTERFYETGISLPNIQSLFHACDLPAEISDLETDLLIGKELVIRIKDTEYVDRMGELKQKKIACDFEKSIPLIDKKE